MMTINPSHLNLVCTGRDNQGEERTAEAELAAARQATSRGQDGLQLARTELSHAEQVLFTLPLKLENLDPVRPDSSPSAERVLLPHTDKGPAGAVPVRSARSLVLSSGRAYVQDECAQGRFLMQALQSAKVVKVAAERTMAELQTQVLSTAKNMADQPESLVSGNE